VWEERSSAGAHLFCIYSLLHNETRYPLSGDALFAGAGGDTMTGWPGTEGFLSRLLEGQLADLIPLERRQLGVCWFVA